VEEKLPTPTLGEKEEVQMRIAWMYSLNGGKEAIDFKHAREFKEIQKVVAAIDCLKHRTKISKEKTMPGKVLFDPKALNLTFKKQFESFGWKNIRVASKYSSEKYIGDYKSKATSRGAFRDMDFVKNRLGVEVQFGKYSFMVYNVSAKMTIFHNLDIIDTGIEIVPIKEFANDMSSGVSYFEQIVWDLEQRGVADIDIPVLILGITK
jgi:hypothetical protein